MSDRIPLHSIIPEAIIKDLREGFDYFLLGIDLGYQFHHDSGTIRPYNYMRHPFNERAKVPITINYHIIDSSLGRKADSITIDSDYLVPSFVSRIMREKYEDSPSYEYRLWLDKTEETSLSIFPIRDINLSSVTSNANKLRKQLHPDLRRVSPNSCLEFLQDTNTGDLFPQLTLSAVILAH